MDTIGLGFLQSMVLGETDMALFHYQKTILKGEAVMFLTMSTISDFAILSDMVEGVLKVLLKDSDEKKGIRFTILKW